MKSSNNLANNKKILIFHPALAPYRVDFFNEINTAFDSSFYFNLLNVKDQKFNQEELIEKCNFNLNYLSNGFEFFGRSFRFGIIKILRKEKPDIVLCSEYGQVTIVVFLYKILFRKQFSFYTISDDSIENSKSRQGLRSLLRNLISKNCDGVIFPSKEVCNWYRSNVSKTTKTLELPIIHNDKVFRSELLESLDIANENIINFNLEGKKVILFVGRLVEVKNLAFLVKVVAQIKTTDWVLVIVGDGELMNDLKEQAKKLNIFNNVLFVGRKEGKELVSWYTLSQIFVLPSIYEPFGAVVNEALLGGCKVLCSEIAGASSLIDADNGRLFSPYSEKELISLLEDSFEEIGYTPNFIHGIRESKMPFTFKEKIEVLIKNL
ncbi:MAG: N-acetylgalactosamine-N, N-diacetylbacillosaminyl-diphospho-undecaprenol [Bacteroidota bacterium]|jgi:glycosyltransferase involved in cell wall biosynthesis